MPILLWDASALAQNYAPEPGTETVEALFAAIPAAQMATTFLGCAETFAALVRKHNREAIDFPAYTKAVSALQNEIIYSEEFGLLEVTSDAVLAGMEWIARYHINASDAAILTCFLDYAQSLAALGHICVLVAADQRLLRAANSEGLKTLDPEQIPAADVPAFLAALS